jgi:hypothetical protein
VFLGDARKEKDTRVFEKESHWIHHGTYLKDFFQDGQVWGLGGSLYRPLFWLVRHTDNETLAVHHLTKVDNPQQTRNPSKLSASSIFQKDSERRGTSHCLSV